VLVVEVVFPRCAGLDIHRDTVVAAVRIQQRSGSAKVQVKTFATTGGALGVLADWLAQNKVTLVGMESTGVYWKPVYYMLEDRFTCWLLNAAHVRNVPGRKTDLLTELRGVVVGGSRRGGVAVATVAACDHRGRFAA
jgi:transposase